MGIIPPPNENEEPSASNVSIARRLWAQLDEIAANETKKDAKRAAEYGRKGKVYSRNKVIESLLTWAVEAYWEKEGETKKK